MNQEITKLQENNAYLRQRLSMLTSKVECLTLETEILQSKVSKYKILLKESRENSCKIEKLVGIQIGEISKTDSIEELSFQSQIQTLILSDHCSTVDYWIAKREKRRETITTRTRRNYSMDIAKKC